jgi:hypothetical protein
MALLPEVSPDFGDDLRVQALRFEKQVCDESDAVGEPDALLHRDRNARSPGAVQLAKARIG